jgi:TonB family protein
LLSAAIQLINRSSPRYVQFAAKTPHGFRFFFSRGSAEHERACHAESGNHDLHRGLMWVRDQPAAQMPLRQLAVPPPVIVPNGTPLRDPAHPAIVHWEYYPGESKRQNEQGSCMVKLTVVIEGPVQDTVLTISSGCSRLDAACLKAFRSERFLPATQDGKPIVSSIELPINWRLGTR